MTVRLSLPRLAVLAVIALILLAGAAEISFRLVAGEKLLYRADPAIEYLPLPDQSVHRRGVEMRTNAWGMRSAPVEEAKPAGVFRLLVLGDSVAFGVNLDHDDLATTRLSGLALEDGRKLETLNVSALSWGPGNLLAWLDAYGEFDADAAILILSSHDLQDDRTFAAPDTDAFPRAQPRLALPDWIARKLRPATDAPASDPRSPGDARRSLPQLLARLALLPQGACLIVHATTDESRSTPSAAEAELAANAAGHGLAVIHDRDFINPSFGYFDDIHLSAAGQAELAEAMKACPALGALVPG